MVLGIVGCTEENFYESFLCFDADKKPALFAERIDEKFFDIRFYNANGNREEPDEYLNDIPNSKYRIVFDKFDSYHLAQEIGGFTNVFILTPASDGGISGSKFSYPAKVQFTSLTSNFTGWRQVFSDCNYIPN